MDYGTVTSDNIVHALIQRRKMEINKYVKVMKLIELEEHKANQAMERTRVSFLQAKQKRRKEWWRMDNHFRESLRKDLEANVKIKNAAQSQNENPNLLTNSTNNNKFAEFNLPLIISNNYNEIDINYSKRSNTFLLGTNTETGDNLIKKTSFNNNTVHDKSSSRKAPITPHNSPNMNVVLKPAKSVMLHTTTQIPLSQIQSKNLPEITSETVRSPDEKENNRRPLSVNLYKIIAQRKNELVPPIKLDESTDETLNKNNSLSNGEFLEINKEKSEICNSKLLSDRNGKHLENKKDQDIRKLMKTTLLFNKQNQQNSHETDDYQQTVNRFLWKTPYHVETSGLVGKLEAETNSITRQISKQKSLTLTRDSRYHNLLKSLVDIKKQE